jgi:hypothetical protein
MNCGANNMPESCAAERVSHPFVQFHSSTPGALTLLPHVCPPSREALPTCSICLSSTPTPTSDPQALTVPSLAGHILPLRPCLLHKHQLESISR